MLLYPPSLLWMPLNPLGYNSNEMRKTETGKYICPHYAIAEDFLCFSYYSFYMLFPSDYFPLRSADLCLATGSMDLATAQKELSALGYVIGSMLTVNAPV